MELYDNQFKYISDYILNNDNFIITAHETPDGDAIGSESAMYGVLKSLGKNVYIINADPMAEKYTFLDYEKSFNVLHKDYLTPKNIEKYTLIILDTNDIENIGEVNDRILKKTDTFMDSLLRGVFIIVSASSYNAPHAIIVSLSII